MDHLYDIGWLEVLKRRDIDLYDMEFADSLMRRKGVYIIFSYLSRKKIIFFISIYVNLSD